MPQRVPQDILLPIFLCFQMFIEMYPWSGFCHTINTGTALRLLQIFCCGPVPWRSSSFRFVGLGPSHTHESGRCWGRPVWSSGTGLERYLKWSDSQLSYILTTGVASPAFPLLAYSMPQLSKDRARYPTQMSLGVALLLPMSSVSTLLWWLG